MKINDTVRFKDHEFKDCTGTVVGNYCSTVLVDVRGVTVATQYDNLEVIPSE